jgi:hypothetical protein
VPDAVVVWQDYLSSLLHATFSGKSSRQVYCEPVTCIPGEGPPFSLSRRAYISVFLIAVMCNLFFPMPYTRLKIIGFASQFASQNFQSTTQSMHVYSKTETSGRWGSILLDEDNHGNTVHVHSTHSSDCYHPYPMQNR